MAFGYVKFADSIFEIFKVLFIDFLSIQLHFSGVPLTPPWSRVATKSMELVFLSLLIASCLFITILINATFIIQY